jgi:hypothetical protein
MDGGMDASTASDATTPDATDPATPAGRTTAVDTATRAGAATPSGTATRAGDAAAVGVVAAPNGSTPAGGTDDAGWIPSGVPAARATRPVPAAGTQAERPPLVGQISYIFSGRMPSRYADWVFQDLTGPRWRWRQALRSVLMMLPFAIILAVLPGPVGTRAMLDAFLLVAAAGMGLALSGAFRNRRLVQNGFAPIARPEEDEDQPARSPAPAKVTEPVAAEASAAVPAGVATAGRNHGEDPDGINA